LNHIPRPFCFSYFSGRVSHFCQETARPWSYFLCLTHNWDLRILSPCPVCWLRWGLTNFLPVFASNHHTPDLHHLSEVTGVCHHTYLRPSAWPTIKWTHPQSSSVLTYDLLLVCPVYLVCTHTYHVLPAGRTLFSGRCSMSSSFKSVRHKLV
jgi:hypothetical protein